MELLIIGKPAMNIYLPLQEFPEEGDTFLINTKNESVGNVGATSACLLSKWGVSTHFTGVTGNDAYAEKIRDTFKTFKVDAKYMETDFQSSTSVNYYVLNAKSGAVTKVLYNDTQSCLKKFKYDFNPEFAIIDGTDIAGAFAFLNNTGSAKTIFYGRSGDKDSITISKRCTWSVVTEKFCEMLTKMECDGTAEGYVNLYQKIVDTSGQSNYIVILNSHKILYCVDGKVKMLPEMKINIADSSSFDSIFVGTLTFALINQIEIDDAIKLANTAAAISQSKIGEIDSIPEVDEVLDNSGLREKLGLAKKQEQTSSTPAAIEPLNPNVSVNADQNSAANQNNNPQVETQGQDAFNAVPDMNQNANPTEMPTMQTQTPQPIPMPEVQQSQNTEQNV